MGIYWSIRYFWIWDISNQFIWTIMYQFHKWEVTAIIQPWYIQEGTSDVQEGRNDVSLVSNAPVFTNYDLMEVLNQGTIKLLKSYSSKQLNGRPNVLTNDEYVSFTHQIQYFLCQRNSSIQPVSLANKNVLQLLKESLDPVELDRIIFQNNFNVRKEKQLIDLLNILNSLELENWKGHFVYFS